MEKYTDHEKALVKEIANGNVKIKKVKMLIENGSLFQASVRQNETEFDATYVATKMILEARWHNKERAFEIYNANEKEMEEILIEKAKTLV